MTAAAILLDPSSYSEECGCTAFSTVLCKAQALSIIFTIGAGAYPESPLLFQLSLVCTGSGCLELGIGPISALIFIRISLSSLKLEMWLIEELCLEQKCHLMASSCNSPSPWAVQGSMDLILFRHPEFQWMSVSQIYSVSSSVDAFLLLCSPQSSVASKLTRCHLTVRLVLLGIWRLGWAC